MKKVRDEEFLTEIERAAQRIATAGPLPSASDWMKAIQDERDAIPRDMSLWEARLVEVAESDSCDAWAAGAAVLCVRKQRATLEKWLAAMPKCDWAESHSSPECGKPATREFDCSHYHAFACDEHAEPEKFWDLPYAELVRESCP